jgi:DNA-binding response OmpR family regulator
MTKKRILVVDDDAQVMFTTKRLLETWGYEVSCAADWKQALPKAIKKDFDLILMDIILPDVSGTTMFKEIKKRKPNAKIMFFSAVAPSQDTMELVKKEGLPFVHKPFNPEQLHIRIRKALGEE